MDCENVPPEMLGRFDQPWTFVGEVKGDRPYLQALCKRCEERNRPMLFSADPSPLYNVVYQIVDLVGHLFITDDMIEVVVYFGVCGECDAVHWARQGPPFKRARCLVKA